MTAPPPAMPAAKPARKKRRWLLYTGLAVAGLFVLGVALLVALAAYWSSLIATYTEPQPKPLPPFEFTPEARDAVISRWLAFRKNIEAGKSPPPFELSAEDVNTLLADKAPTIEDKVRVVIDQDKLRAQFSLSLAKPGEPKLQGRYLNGRATLNLSFADGWPDLRVATVEANGKPIPRWLLRRLQKLDLLKDVSSNPAFVQMLQDTDNIRVSDGAVVIKPVAPQ